LNEIITPLGVTGITQIRSKMLEASQAVTCVNPGNYCPRCSDEILLKKKIKAAQKELNKKNQPEIEKSKNTDQTKLPGHIIYNEEIPSRSSYVSTKRVPPPTSIPDTITVPKGHYTKLLAEIEKLKLKNQRIVETNKSLKSDLATTRKLLMKKPQQGVVEVQEPVSSEETN
jgi:DNA-directed RNA polymerase subunit RPC12/RpoP